MKIKNKKSIFARHQTFHLRDGWITKGLELVNEEGNFKDDSHHDIGVGINMIKSIKHWLEASSLIKANKTGFELTELGDFIYKNDRYFEDDASLWMIHYMLTKNITYAPVWFYIFNENQDSTEFEIGKTEFFISSYFNKINKMSVSINSIIKDLRCFSRTYTTDKAVDEFDISCPLSELNLVNRSAKNNMFNLNFGKKDSLPLEVFLISIIDFIGVSTDVEIGRLRFNPLSPGRVFCLSFDAIRDYIAEACYKHPSFFTQVRTYESEDFRILDEPKKIKSFLMENLY